MGIMALSTSSIGYSIAVSPNANFFTLQFSPMVSLEYPRDNFGLSVLTQSEAVPYNLNFPQAISIKPSNDLLEMNGRKFYLTDIDGIGIALKVGNKALSSEKNIAQFIGDFSDHVNLSGELIVYKKLLSGVYSLNPQVIAEMQVGDESNNIIPIKLLPTVINVKQKTCELVDKTQTVKLRTISPMDIAGKRSEIYGGSFQLRLHCDPEVAAHITFWDQTEYSNRTSILNLDKSSTAKGVGLKLYKENQAVMLGQEWLFADNQRQPQQNFEVNYVNLGEKLSPGSVKAVAAITFSYR